MTTFLNPLVLEKINAATDRLMAQWDIDKNERHTVYQMVAMIESGMDTLVFYDGNGIVCEGWNGYKDRENRDCSPRAAFAGFYRMDKKQMFGWSIYMIDRADDKEKQAALCWNVYGYRIHWEDRPHLWGFVSYEDYHTPEEQRAAADLLETLPQVKRIELDGKSESSWMYRLHVQTTRKKSGLRNEWKGRVLK